MLDNNSTFSEWADIWLNLYKKDYVKVTTFEESYRNIINRYLVPYFGDRKINEITPLDIRGFISDMGKIYSKSTLSKMLICLNGIFETSIENSAAFINPAKNVKISSSVASKAKRTYTKAEAEEIIAFSYGSEYGIFIHLLLELGLRASELCGLQWKDVDFAEKTVSIRRACTSYRNQPYVAPTKNRTSERVLPASTKLINHLADSQRRGKYIVASKRNPDNPITPSSFTKVYYNPFFAELRQEDEGLDLLSPHELRHTCGTLLYQRTHDIYAVSKFMGHASISITAKLYVHCDAEALRTALMIE